MDVHTSTSTLDPMSGLGIPVALGLITLGLLALGGALAWLWRWQQDAGGRLARELARLEGSLGAVIAGTAGADRRAGRLEQRLLELQRRIEDLEEMQRVTRPYDEAIRLVRQGAAAERLVQELGLSRGEADLLIMLHGSRDGPTY
jgi:Protein of unknown function (DUF2802)